MNITLPISPKPIYDEKKARIIQVKVMIKSIKRYLKVLRIALRRKKKRIKKTYKDI